MLNSGFHQENGYHSRSDQINLTFQHLCTCWRFHSCIRTFCWPIPLSFWRRGRRATETCSLFASTRSHTHSQSATPLQSLACPSTTHPWICFHWTSCQDYSVKQSTCTCLLWLLFPPGFLHIFQPTANIVSPSLTLLLSAYNLMLSSCKLYSFICRPQSLSQASGWLCRIFLTS